MSSMQDLSTDLCPNITAIFLDLPVIVPTRMLSNLLMCDLGDVVTR